MHLPLPAVSLVSFSGQHDSDSGRLERLFGSILPELGARHAVAVDGAWLSGRLQHIPKETRGTNEITRCDKYFTGR